MKVIAKAIYPKAKPAVRRTRSIKTTALDRLSVARQELNEAYECGVDVLYQLDPTSLSTANTLRFLTHASSALKALKSLDDNINAIKESKED